MLKSTSIFKFFKEDFSASIALFLISLPITVGIAVASGVPSEAGIISAIFGALFFGIFSSSNLAMFGPAAGLCVFLAAHAQNSRSASDLGIATLFSGIILTLLAFFRAFRIIHIFPMSVIKGMMVGIGLTLVLKMIPHLVGFDHTVMESVNFVDIDSAGGTTWSDLLQSWNLLNPGALIIACISFAIIWLQQRKSENTALPYAFLVLLTGTAVNWIFGMFFPKLSLHDHQLIHMTSGNFSITALSLEARQWWPSIRLSLIITTVILLEGFINFELIQKIDPKHAPIKPKREMFLLGIGNIVMGLLGALPVMPILIRSSANIEFGAKTRLSTILVGIWLLIAFSLSTILDRIPMASVAALLALVGFHLIKKVNFRELTARGKAQIAPFMITVILILSIDLLWGILAGFAMGMFFTLRSLVKRSMFVVNDGHHYLVKFFKDVTFIHKAELIDHLSSIPQDKPIVLDGTGNVSLDPEIEDWLIEYQEDEKNRGREVTFARSNLAISKLFKGVRHG